LQNPLNTTTNNHPLLLNFPLNYPPPTQILSPSTQISQKLKQPNLQPQHITQHIFSTYLITQSLQHPHLLIPTTAEITLSNFILSQIPYSQ
ncbi:undecaprenyl diphosphate synthase family protein, partial [Bacillus pumilus]|uniref:undecaprenyl diphosphate synthase family protein n=1 Tax=Bacillus pumilus TaxID=1408 RepID=UPI001642B7F5